MKVERLTSPGGVRVGGRLSDGDPFTILRLSSEGVTRVSFYGYDLDYDVSGKLVLAFSRLTEFSKNQTAQMMAGLGADFWETINYLQLSGVEVEFEIDFEKDLIEIYQRDRMGKKLLSSFILSYYLSKTLPVVIGNENEIWGTIGFQVEMNEEEKRVKFGIGDMKNVMWVSHPTQMDLSHLAGKIDVEEIDLLFKGL